MNHYSPLNNGNYPVGVTQRDIDAVFGKPMSDRAADAIEVHARVQNLISGLRAALAANPDVLAMDRYEDLSALLEGAEADAAKIEAAVLDAEENESGGAMFDNSDYEYEQRRDEGDW